MIKYGVKVLLGVTLSICLTFLSRPATAGYVVVEFRSCAQGKCVSKIDPKDPNQEALYQILLDHSWPTAQLNKHYDVSKTEIENLNDALERLKSERKYTFIWIPDLLEDLSCATGLIKSDKLVMGKLGKPALAEYFDLEEKSKGEFSSQSTDFLRKRVKRNETNPAVMKYYFESLNHLGVGAYFHCNQFFLTQLGIGEDWTLEQLKRSLQGDSLRSLRATVSKAYESAVRDINDSVVPILYRSLPRIISVPKNETYPSSRTLFDRVISLEEKAHSRNEAFLFRGTGGITTPKGLILEFPFKPGDREYTQDLSSSYGGTLYSGLFAESFPLGENNQSAVAMGYVYQSRFGYAVHVNKNSFYSGGEERQLFEVPPISSVGRLFAAGEYFHVRSKVGSQGVDGTLRVSGVFGAHSIDHYKALGLLINDQTPQESAVNLASYVAKNSVILSSNGSIPTSEERKKILKDNLQIIQGGLFGDEKDQFKLVNELKNHGRTVDVRAIANDLKWATLSPKVLVELAQLLTSPSVEIRQAVMIVLNLQCPRDLVLDVYNMLFMEAKKNSKNHSLKSMIETWIRQHKNALEVKQVEQLESEMKQAPRYEAEELLKLLSGKGLGIEKRAEIVADLLWGGIDSEWAARELGNVLRSDDTLVVRSGFRLIGLLKHASLRGQILSSISYRIDVLFKKGFEREVREMVQSWEGPQELRDYIIRAKEEIAKATFFGMIEELAVETTTDQRLMVLVHEISSHALVKEFKASHRLKELMESVKSPSAKAGIIRILTEAVAPKDRFPVLWKLVLLCDSSDLDLAIRNALKDLLKAWDPLKLSLEERKDQNYVNSYSRIKAALEK